MRDKRHGAVRWLERALILGGVVCLGWWAVDRVQRVHYEHVYAAEFEKVLRQQSDRRLASSAEARSTPPPAADRVRPSRTELPEDSTDVDPAMSGTRSAARATRATLSADRSALNERSAVRPSSTLLGMLEVPRIGLRAPVLSGDDRATLRRAAGHLPDTPRPWEPGNSAIAAHRDGLFRPLQRVRIGDEIKMRTVEGELVYRVSETWIVAPDDVSVLERTETDSLTLITCYPFSLLGHAPNRFIVRAERVDTELDR